MTDTSQAGLISPEILDVTKICGTFPAFSGVQISRDNLHNTLETILDGEIYLLTVEGAEGIGKTTLLAQFAQRHIDRCISMFVHPTSRLTYDPTMLRADLCNQMKWIISKEEIPASRASDRSLYRQLIMELQRRARRPDQRFYFIIDGLDSLEQDGGNVQNLIDLLPVGLPQFKFLFSGSTEELSKLTRRKILCKSVPIPGFTLDETTKFFSDTSVSPELIGEFYKTCKGIPARLAALKRIVESGIPASSLSEQPLETMAGLFEIEWKAVDDNNELQLNILALLSDDSRNLTVRDVAGVFQTDPQRIRESLKPLGFITTPSDDTREVSFISEAFRALSENS